MIDIHSHILPNLDDGSQGIDESIAMARAAMADGIDTIIATPHHANGKFHNDAITVEKAVKALNAQLKQEGIAVEIKAGQEIRVYRGLIDDLEHLHTLHNSRYMLLEYPSSEIPSYTYELLHELCVMNITPIIAHPERNQEIAQDPSKLLQMVEMGALTQLTSHSLTGLFGKSIQNLSLKLCDNNLAHFISNDAHNITRRSFGLKQAYQLIGAKLGNEYVEFFQNNAAKVITNEPIEIRRPVWPKHKWFQFWKSS